MPEPRLNPMECAHCRMPLKHIGRYPLPKGPAAGTLPGGPGDIFAQRERFDAYVCPRCGRVELFAEGIGEEFRVR